MSDVGVGSHGAILLGPTVSADGFHIERRIRIQTHWHSDHMEKFGASKRGDIVTSGATLALLTPEHPDLEIRANVHVVPPGEPHTILGNRIRLEKSTHSLGAVQAAVELDDGKWVGYSGDFSWPLNGVIEVDELVVDATYGDPARDRSYDQEDAEREFVDQVREGIRYGPVHLFCRGGTGERALALLNINDLLEDRPVVANRRFCHSLEVHRKEGYPVPEAHRVHSEDGRRILQTERYIRCWAYGQKMSNDALNGTCIRLTKFSTHDEPVEKVADNSYIIGLSNHADFDGTMKYIENTGARYVLTDGSRCSHGKARALAAAIERELGIRAEAAIPQESFRYGT